jgi:hypothetical protein
VGEISVVNKIIGGEYTGCIEIRDQAHGAPEWITTLVPLTGDRGQSVVLGDKKPWRTECTVLGWDEQRLSLELEGLSLKQGDDLNSEGISLSDSGYKAFNLRRDEMVELNTCMTGIGHRWRLTYKWAV